MSDAIQTGETTLWATQRLWGKAVASISLARQAKSTSPDSAGKERQYSQDNILMNDIDRELYPCPHPPIAQCHLLNLIVVFSPPLLRAFRALEFARLPLELAWLHLEFARLLSEFARLKWCGDVLIQPASHAPGARMTYLEQVPPNEMI